MTTNHECCSCYSFQPLDCIFITVKQLQAAFKFRSRTCVDNMVHCLLPATIACQWFGTTPFVQVCTTQALTRPWRGGAIGRYDKLTGAINLVCLDWPDSADWHLSSGCDVLVVFQHVLSCCFVHIFLYYLFYINSYKIIPKCVDLHCATKSSSTTRNFTVGHQTCELQVARSSPASAPLRSGLGQATYTYVPLSPSSITWYRSKGRCLATGECRLKHGPCVSGR